MIAVLKYGNFMADVFLLYFQTFRILLLFILKNKVSMIKSGLIFIGM